MDLSLSEFLAFLFSKKPQFLKTFSICVHFCRLAPIYFGSWGAIRELPFFETKRALFLFIVISNFFGSDFFISVVQPLMKMAFQTVLFDL